LGKSCPNFEKSSYSTNWIKKWLFFKLSCLRLIEVVRIDVENYFCCSAGYSLYAFSILLFRYLSSGRHKMSNFWKLSSATLVWDVIMVGCFGDIRYLSSRQWYFGKIVGRAKKYIGWQNELSLMLVKLLSACQISMICKSELMSTSCGLNHIFIMGYCTWELTPIIISSPQQNHLIFQLKPWTFVRKKWKSDGFLVYIQGLNG
jgi:hypothetical protein